MECRKTQTELASRLGITQTSLCHTELGKSTPPLIVILEIAKHLRTTLADLCQGILSPEKTTGEKVPPTPAEIMGVNLKKAMRAKQWTLEHLAKASRYTKKYLSTIMKGKSKSLLTYLTIARALNISADELCEGLEQLGQEATQEGAFTSIP
jgi:transcriptional regulator with XRE-family HTH domain